MTMAIKVPLEASCSPQTIVEERNFSFSRLSQPYRDHFSHPLFSTAQATYFRLPHYLNQAMTIETPFAAARDAITHVTLSLTLRVTELNFTYITQKH